MSGSSPCSCRTTSPFQTTYVVHSRTGERALQLAVTALGHDPRISVVSFHEGLVAAGGSIGVRDVRRVARALSNGQARTFVELRAEAPLPGGRLAIQQEEDEVFLVVTPTGGQAPALFGPVSQVALAAVCRDLVAWSRLLTPRPPAPGDQPANLTVTA